MVAAGWPAYAWSFPISGPGHVDRANVGFGMLRSSLAEQEGSGRTRARRDRSPPCSPTSRPTPPSLRAHPLAAVDISPAPARRARAARRRCGVADQSPHRRRDLLRGPVGTAGRRPQRSDPGATRPAPRTGGPLAARARLSSGDDDRCSRGCRARRKSSTPGWLSPAATGRRWTRWWRSVSAGEPCHRCCCGGFCGALSCSVWHVEYGG